ncbi:MAG: hypothetical protein K6F92_03840 [Lachnospiraceae bacterium]|nr:hypothetical protein [Lachnospiraceae bacterium]
MRDNSSLIKEFILIIAVFSGVFIIWNFVFLAGLIFGVDIGENKDFFDNFENLIFLTALTVDDGWSVSMFAISESMVFMGLYGAYWYRRMDIDGIYYFVRQPSRKKWILKTSLQLLGITAFWGLLQVGVPYILSSLYTDTDFSFMTFLLFIIMYLSITLFNYFSVYLVNIFSMRYGTVISFIIVYCFYIFCFIGMSFTKDNRYPLAYFAPTEVTLVKWEDDIGSIKAFVDINKSTIISLSVLAVYCMTLIFITWCNVDKWDIGLKSRENV